MRAGKRPDAVSVGRAVLVENVERIFDDVVPGRPDTGQKELSAKLRKPKSLPNFPTVENDRARGALTVLAPLGQHAAVVGKQRHPADDSGGSVSGPVIRCHQPGVQAAAIAKKSKISGEIERIEVAAAVGQSIRWYS